MDQGDSLEAATLRKGEQYDSAVRAVQRGQRSVRFSARTVPLVFGVRGSVDHTDILFHLSPFQLKKPDRVVAAGVRAAVAAASTMIDGRKAKLAEMAAEGRQGSRRRPRAAGDRAGSRRQRRGAAPRGQGGGPGERR